MAQNPLHLAGHIPAGVTPFNDGRAILYDAIMLDATELAVDDDDTTYTGDAAYLVDSPDNLPMETGTCVSPLPNECNPVRTVVGPDGRSYRVDTYIVETAPVADSRAVKIVTVVVRDAQHPITQGMPREWFSRIAVFVSSATFSFCAPPAGAPHTYIASSSRATVMAASTRTRMSSEPSKRT